MLAHEEMDRTHYGIATVDELRYRLLGEVMTPTHAAYDESRQVWNGSVDRRPAFIVRPQDAADVAQTVRFARAHDLPIAVRSGGHSFAGHGTVDGGVVVDMSAMRAMSVDPERQIAWVQSGRTWGEYTGQAQAYGLATPAGDTSTVGVGGLTLGGGIGWLVRKHGLTIDSLISAEVVLADGRIVRASADEHPDLFWALRGGGGNFGIATSFEFRLHPVSTVMGGAVFYRASADLLRKYARVASEASEDVSTITFVMRAPALPFIPVEQHSSLIVRVMMCYSGDPARGEEALAPLRSLETPIADTVGQMSYGDMFHLSHGGTVRSRGHATRSGLMREFDDEIADAIVEAGIRTDAPVGLTQIRVLGGAMARVPVEATAFAHRDKRYLVTAMNSWPESQDGSAQRAWTEALWEKIRRHADGNYVNFLESEGADRVRDAYLPSTFARLAEIKRRYDPANIFRVNQNIRPASPATLQLQPA